MRLRRDTAYRGIGLGLLPLALIAALASPVRSQSDAPLKDGFWVGEALAVVTLEGNVQGSAASFNGVVTADLRMLINNGGSLYGTDSIGSSWDLTGSADMTIEGDMSLDFLMNYLGAGRLAGDRNGITMTGDITTTGSMNGTPATPQTETIDLQIEIVEATCAEIYGDWESPLEQLARDSEWSRVVVDAVFSAIRLEDEESRQSLLEQIEELATEAAEWGQQMVVSGSVDMDTAMALIARAMSLNEYGTVDCTGEPTWRYTVPILSDMIRAIQQALGNGNVSGIDLLKLSGITTALSSPGMGSVYNQIQGEAQRLIDAGLDSDGNTCDPCLADGNSNPQDIRAAALAGKVLGPSFSEFEVDGNSYTADEIITAVTQ